VLKSESYCPWLDHDCHFKANISAFAFREVIYFYDTKAGKTGRKMEEQIEKICKEKGFEVYKCTREKSWSLDWFCTNLCRKIQSAAFVVADLSCWKKKKKLPRQNPNIMFESGVSFGFRKKIIFVVINRDFDDVPSDLKKETVCKWPHDFKPGGVFESQVEEVIKRGPFHPKSIILNYPKEFYKTLMEIEEINGDVYLIQDYPVSFVRPESLLKKRAEAIFGRNKDLQDFYVESTMKRKKVFEHQVERYRFVHIYEKSGMERYMEGKETTDSWDTPAEKGEIIAQIKELIKYLKKYKNYEIYLTKETLPFNFETKRNYCVIMESREKGSGLAGMFFSTKSLVDPFIEVKKRLIDSQFTIKDKKRIINELGKLIR